MRVVVGESQRGPIVSSTLVVGAIALLGFTVLTNFALQITAPVIAVAVTLILGYRRLLSWKALMATVLLVILFIPIKRYEMPSSLPFHLEPYRVVIAFVIVGWLTSLLIDPRVRMRGTIVDKPLLAFLFVVLISIIVNRKRVESVGPDVVKKLIFFLSFVFALYIIVSVIRRYRDVDFLVSVLVGGGAIVAILAIIESRTGYNPFNHMTSFIPFIRGNNYEQFLVSAHRGARLRVYGSGQHPIAFGAALAMIVPLGIYLARTHSRLWWAAVVLLVLGTVSTVSRTAVLMFLVIIAMFVWLRPAAMRRLSWAVLPGLILVHVAMPGTLGTLKNSFFPKQGLIAQQAHAPVGSGRIATLGPSLHKEFRPDPLIGEGFATRVTVPDQYVPVANGPILDNQWLGTLLETGVLGTLSLVWLFLRFVRRAGREAKADQSARGWLLASITSSVAAFGVGMFFFDAFAFIQVTFLFFILLGLGNSVLRTPRGSGPPGKPAPAPAPRAPASSPLAPA